METRQTLAVLQSLLDGINPETGIALPSESVLHSPSVIRALARSVQLLEGEARKQERERLLPRNAGKPWSSDEDAQVCDELNKGLQVPEIARIHGRTNGAIWSRLVHLGKIPADSVPIQVRSERTA